jgi:[ribosomal protein S5]-alanine N-acetyltransferase
MSAAPIETRRLTLVPRTPEAVRAEIEQMDLRDKAQLSPDWLARLRATTTVDPWVLGFALVDHTANISVGSCGFKGPPDADGMVEIAYGIALEQQNKGYATEAAAALVRFAFASGQVRVVRAHTIAEANASARVLIRNGFSSIGPVVDREDGLVWRWEMAQIDAT